MRRQRPSMIVFGGMMAALAAALQLGPIYLPIVGVLLAMVSSLPMAIQALRDPRWAPLSAGVAAVVMFTIAPQEATIFAFTSGPLGLAVGYAIRLGLRRWQAIPMVGAVLLAGILLLAYLIGLPPLGPGLATWSLSAQLGAYASFSLIWGALWVETFGGLSRRLARLAAPATDRVAS